MGNTENVIAEAQAALRRGDPASAVSALKPAKVEKFVDNKTILRNYHQTLVMAEIQVVAAQDDNAQGWWKVFGLDRHHSSVQEVRRAFKRLAAIVHPDKCQLPNAAGSFDALHCGLEVLLEEIDRPNSNPKKRKTNHHNDNDNSVYAWWTEWEQDQDKSRKTSSNNKSPDDSSERIEDLEKLSTAALRAHIRHLQNEILTPVNEITQKKCRTLPELQSAIVQARRVLASKIDQRGQRLPDGGFMMG
jgi:hypothetical protein